jgi:hypothetical protein
MDQKKALFPENPKDRGKFKNLTAGIFGELGSGKTILLTLFGYHYFKLGWKVFSDYHLNFKHNYVKSLEEVFNTNLDQDSVFLFDELWITADARRHATEDNIKLSQFVLQSRKKRLSIFYTAQYPRLVEQRIRMITQYIFKPTIISYNADNTPQSMIIDKFSRNSNGYVTLLGRITPNLNLREIANLYHTEEIISPMNVKNKYDILAEEIIANVKKTKKIPKRKDLISKFVMEDKAPMNRAIVMSDYILSKFPK